MPIFSESVQETPGDYIPVCPDSIKEWSAMLQICTSRGSGIRFRSIMMMIVGIVLGAGVETAWGQLSAEQIEVLRAQGVREGWTFTVSQNPATEYPLDQLCGLVEPPDWQENTTFITYGEIRGLPSSFDWRDFNGCTPVRNQGGCGSCWAFSAIGTMESAIKLGDGINTNLSEQWLVSCTSAGSCAGGWHTEAFDHLLEYGSTDPCGDSGAVMESDFPYVAWNAPCDCPYPHPYHIESWFGVGAAYPTVNEIKQAIMDYGPVSVGVYVNWAFQAYDGGIFNACADESVNHAVVLVGWDDNLGSNGVWIMRNSWGHWWGDDGYMYIEYDCSRIGYATAAVVYEMRDCNGNGVHDDDDIALGTSEDCNENGFPDECDLMYGRSPDGNNNAIPDECESCGMRQLSSSGASIGDQFGRSVSIFANLAVVGVSADDDLGEDAGAAFVYRFEGDQWVEQAKLLASDGEAGDAFGRSVAIDGQTIAVGAWGDDDLGNYSGAVYIFEFDGEQWLETAKVLAPNGQGRDEFGRSVALCGTRLVVGAPGDSDLGTGAGAVYVYELDGQDWINQIKLLASDGVTRDALGEEVDICGDVIIAGAKWDDDADSNSGSAYIFRYNGSSWDETKLLASDAAKDDFFGSDVGVDGDRAVVGSFYDDDQGSKSGSAYVYDYNGSSWDETKILPTDGGSLDNFGQSVSVSGDVIVVGADHADEGGENSGAAYVFRYSGSQWIQEMKLLPMVRMSNDSFGGAVCVHDDVTVVGAWGSDNQTTDAGSAFIFAGLTGRDCDSSGVPDGCEIIDGLQPDCNFNWVPDSCDIDQGVCSDENENGIPDECEDSCPADFNDDGTVNIDDIFIILGAWGQSGVPEDLNGDGTVNIDDIFEALGLWGPC